MPMSNVPDDDNMPGASEAAEPARPAGRWGGAGRLLLLVLNAALLSSFLVLFLTQPAESTPPAIQEPPTWTAQPVLTVAPGAEIVPSPTATARSGSGVPHSPIPTVSPTAPPLPTPAPTATPIPTVVAGGG
ncbi:MAG TPA: hypothetical protein VF040_12155 [Ktedonobacterales bacterium]